MGIGHEAGEGCHGRRGGMVPPDAGERTVRCLLGETVDRIPFGVGIGWSPWGQTLERWRKETGRPDLDPARELGFETAFVSLPVRPGLVPPFERELLSDEGEHVVYRDEKGIVLRARKDGMSMPDFLDYPVKTAADWERIREERLRVGDPARCPADWSGFAAEAQRSGAAVQAGWYPYGVFGTVRDLLGVEAMLVGFYDFPDLIRSMMDHLTGLWLSVYEEAARHVRIDHFHVWEDMSGKQGSLISPAMVRGFMMPQYDRIASFCAGHGVRVLSVDTDGDCSELVPLMRRHGVNAFLPFEVAAGNDIREYRRRYPDLGIFGGLDKRALAWGREAIGREVAKAEWMVAHGRYVPGFDHLIPPDVPWDNFLYAAQRIRELCGAR
jgi:hypothetical protein